MRASAARPRRAGAGPAGAAPSPRWSRSAAAWACPRRSPRCAGSPATSPPSSPWPTTAAPVAGCGTSWACCRPVTCARRWPRCAVTTTGARPGARVIQHRFQTKGDLHDHAVGNLLIVALWEQLGDHVQALDLVGKLLGAHGRVLPMSAVPLELQALVKGHDPERPDDVDTVRGQATVALTPGEVQSVHLVPHDPPAVPEAVAAVLDADWVVLGPGSWFSLGHPAPARPRAAGRPSPRPRRAGCCP